MLGPKMMLKGSFNRVAAGDTGDGISRIPSTTSQVSTAASSSHLNLRMQASMTAKKKRREDLESQRSRLSTSSASTPWNDVYFFLLDSSYTMVSLAVILAYVLTIALLSVPLLLSVSVGGSPMDDESFFEESDENMLGQAHRAIFYTATNIVTMGFKLPPSSTLPSPTTSPALTPALTLTSVWGGD